MGLALGLLAVMAGLLAASETAAQAVREGLALCGGFGGGYNDCGC